MNTSYGLGTMLGYPSIESFDPYFMANSISLLASCVTLGKLLKLSVTSVFSTVKWGITQFTSVAQSCPTL